MTEMMIINSLVKIKEAPPYIPELEVPVLMNSMARAIFDTKTGSYSFPAKLAKEAPSDRSNAKAVAGIIGGIESTAGVGVDQGTLQYIFCVTNLISLFFRPNRTYFCCSLTQSNFPCSQLHAL
jgi:hypothetical protein